MSKLHRLILFLNMKYLENSSKEEMSHWSKMNRYIEKAYSYLYIYCFIKGSVIRSIAYRIVPFGYRDFAH